MSTALHSGSTAAPPTSKPAEPTRFNAVRLVIGLDMIGLRNVGLSRRLRVDQLARTRMGHLAPLYFPPSTDRSDLTTGFAISSSRFPRGLRDPVESFVCNGTEDNPIVPTLLRRFSDRSKIRGLAKLLAADQRW
jgi:hypothetical protein